MKPFLPLEDVGGSDGGAHREPAADVMIVPLRVLGHELGTGLTGILLELLHGEGAGQRLPVLHIAHIEPDGGAPGERVARVRGEPVAELLAVVAEAVEAGDGIADVEVEGPVHLAGGQVCLVEAERAALGGGLEETRIVSGLRHEVDGAPQAVGAEAERIAALVDLDPLGEVQVQGLEVAEPIGLAIGEPVDQDVHAAEVEVVAEAGAADGELALVGGADARSDEHAGNEVERVLQVRPARIHLPLAHDLDPARYALDALARLLLRLGALVGHADALHDDGRKLGRGRSRGLGSCGRATQQHGDQQGKEDGDRRHRDLLGYRSRNCTGIRTHMLTRSLPWRAGSNCHRVTASAAARSRSGCPPVCSTCTSATRPSASTWTRSRVVPSMPSRRAVGG